MLIGIEHVISWIETNATPYWRVLDGSGEKAGLIFSAKPTDDESGIAISDSTAKLRRCLETLGAGNYVIKAWTTPGQKREWNTTRFQLTGPAQHTPAAIAGPAYDPGAVAKQIADALAAKDKEYELKDLKAKQLQLEKELKDAKGELDGSGIRIFNRFEQFAPILAKALGVNETPPISGPPANNTPVTVDDTERIAQLMEQWAATDPEFEKTLSGIVQLAKSNRGKYDVGKKFLT